MKIYLDNCCYNRLFDDRTNIKNYLEREAILIIMQKAYEKELQLIGSDILEIEIGQIKNLEKRSDVFGVYNALIDETIKITPNLEERAAQIQKLSNIKAFDSLHLASAEIGANILLTTDIKFLKGSQKIAAQIPVKNPVQFVMEVFNYVEPNHDYH